MTTNNGSWPSLIRFDRADTNAAAQGQSILVSFYYQWAQPVSSNATISFYLDNDLNPLNTNQTLLKQISAPGSGASSVDYGAILLPLPATNASVGSHWLFAVINGGGQSRWLYAPEPLEVVAPPQPVLGISRLNASQMGVVVYPNGLSGQSVVLQSSTDLIHWQPIATNTLTTNAWIYTNTMAGGTNQLYFRSVLGN